MLVILTSRYSLIILTLTSVSSTNLLYDLGLEEGWTEVDEESVSLLSKLKLSQPDKYIKLRQRLVKPPSQVIGLTKEATFTGQETFFKLFIDVSIYPLY